MASRYDVHPMEQSFQDWQRQRSGITKIISNPLKYGDCMSKFPLRDHCEEKAKRLEMPHFTLIASDNLAISAIEYWLAHAMENGLPEAKRREAKAIIAAMLDWRNEHPDLCKNPD